MAYGVIKIIPASSHAEIPLSGMGGGTQYPSIKILNPNDGVVYVARNRDCLGVNYGMWDWKVPSQSYAALPGPFQAVGAFYLDQSGAGRQGEITFYPSQQSIDDPLFVAIGRALQAQTTSLDIVEGTLPANPGSGILRLWADGSDLIHAVNGAGVDRSVIDTVRALGGTLTGTLPNPSLVDGSVTLAKLALNAATQIVQSASYAAQSTTSTVFVAIPNASITITPRGGPILLIWSFSAFLSAGAVANFAMLRGGANINNIGKLGATTDTPVSFIGFDQPASGAAVTYQLAWAVTTGSVTMSTSINAMGAAIEFDR